MPFAIRWSLLHGELDLLVEVLKRMADDKAEVRRRLLEMHASDDSPQPLR